MQIKFICNLYPVHRGQVQKMLRIMRLTCVLLLAAFIHVSANSVSQKVTISERNVKLNKVFSEIEKQTGYNFVFTNALLRRANPVTAHVKDVTVPEVLDICFKNQALTYIIIENIIVVKPNSIAIHDSNLPILLEIISGRIVDEAGVGVMGAAVQVKGSSTTTTTNENGYFSINVTRADAILIISGVNIETQEISVKSFKNGSDIKVQNKVTGLSEVSVLASTGYQKISKERSTAAYDVIGRDILDKKPVSNLSTALQGMVPGLQGKEKSDGSFNFLVRGNSSLYADSKPLLVVDGFPVADTSFTTINPNDVESVTLLKDAAAASIWGARSANGVLVITTKQAKNGFKIDFNTFTRVGQMIDLDQILTIANSKDFVAYEKLAWENNWALSRFNGAFTSLRTSLTLAQEMLYAHDGGKLSAEALSKGLDSLSNINNKGQLKDLLLERPNLTQYNLSLSGGNEKLKSFASLLYETNKNGYVGNLHNRYMLNFNNQYKASKFLTLYLGAALQYTDQRNNGATSGEMSQLSPYEMLLNADGSYGVNLKEINRELLSTLPLDKLPYSDWTFNLLREVRARNFSTKDLSARIQTGITIEILKGLSFDSKFQYEKRSTDYKNYYSEDSYFARNLVNYTIDYNIQDKIVNKVFVPKGGIETPQLFNNRYVSNISNENYVFRNQINFDRYFGSKHAITAIAGMEVSQYVSNTRGNPWLYGYIPEKLQTVVPPFGFGSVGNTFKNIVGSTGVTLQGGNTFLDWELNKFVSFYGNASYTYNGKYTISGSARTDASNYITDDPSLRWSPFWSLGGKWNVIREDFMQEQHLFDDLSVRVTIGRNGNAEKSTSTKTLLNVQQTVNTTTGTITATISDYGNPLLRWEKTTTTNFGVDFSILDRKLFGKIDYYNKRGSDIVGIVSLPSAVGTTQQKFNNAKIENNGIELALSTNVMIPGTAIGYNTTVTYAYNKNKVTELYFPSIYGFDMLSGNSFVQGRPVGSVYSYEYLGMKDGEPYVAGVKGVPNRFDDLALHNRGLGLQYLNYNGTAVPPHTLGWYNSFKAYNFSLSVLFTGTMGGVYRNPIFNYATLIGSGKTFVSQYVADVFAGDPNIPSFPVQNDPGTYRWDRYAPNLGSLVESSSYIECKEITLDYVFANKITKAIAASSLRLYLQARNVGMVYRENKNGYNPDWLPGTNKPLRTITAGLNVQF